MYTHHDEFGLPFPGLDAKPAENDPGDAQIPVSDWVAAGLLGATALVSFAALLAFCWSMGWLRVD